MTSELVVLVPVLGRPQRVRPLLASIHLTTPQARVLFLADPKDYAECRAIRRERRTTPLQVDALACGGTYAEKINTGAEQSSEPLLFIGADDLDFKAGWFEAAKRRVKAGAQVVGVNDMIERQPRRHRFDGPHATHFLMSREYASLSAVDGGRGPLSEAYTHNFCDDELIGTARKRGVYAYVEDAEVAHLHPMTGGAIDDATYQKGRRTFGEDRKTFLERCSLWT